MQTSSAAKICCLCKNDCSAVERMKDPQGNYYCRTCYEEWMAEHQRRSAAAPASPPAGVSSGQATVEPKPKQPPVPTQPSGSPPAPRRAPPAKGNGFLRTPMGLGAIILGIALFLLVMSHAGFVHPVVWVGAVVAFGFVVSVIALVSAFRTSLVQGLLSLFIPFYVLIYVFVISASERLKVLTGVSLVLWLGFFALPWDDAVESMQADIQSALAPQSDGQNSVTIKITGVSDDTRQGRISEMLGDMPEGGGVSMSTLTINDSMTVNLSPVSDVNAFANRIAFGRVTSVQGREIHVDASP